MQAYITVLGSLNFSALIKSSVTSHLGLMGIIFRTLLEGVLLRGLKLTFHKAIWTGVQAGSKNWRVFRHFITAMLGINITFNISYGYMEKGQISKRMSQKQSKRLESIKRIK